MAKNNEEKPFLTDEQIAILKKDLLFEFNAADQEAFITVVQLNRLDPFTKQIYALPSKKQKDRDGKWLDIMIHAGIQGLRTVADRSGVYDGSDPIQWCDKEGTWTEIWTSTEDPFAARATVWRKDHTRPEIAIAYWKARCQTHWDSDAKARVRNDIWANDGPNMLAKCAEAAALRKLFPSQLTGVYEEGERPTHDDIATPTAPAPTVLEQDIAAQEARIKEEAAAAERLKAQGVSIVTPKAPEAPRDAKKEVEPPDDLSFEPPPSVTDDDSWKNISCDLIKPFAGRVVADLDLSMLLQAVEKWVPKVRAKWNDTTQPYRDLAEALEKGLEEAQKQEAVRQANASAANAESAQ